LISWINKEIYGNSLLIFPYANPNQKKHEVRLHITDEAEKAAAGNPIRSWAGHVVDDLLEHVRAHPEHSIGVVAQTASDVELLMRELDRKRRKDQVLEKFFRGPIRDRFYVKTIERAQGDTRDVIFLALPLKNTVKPAADANRSLVAREDVMRRRLAILGSLVRKACYVYTDMTLEEIDRWSEGRPGFAVLSRFLQFMDSNVINVSRPAVASKFEMAVGDALKANGYLVEYQVGYANSCIDMAVVDETNPGAYLLGIQSDGYSYENARSARERERLQPEQLKKQGWQLHRIWSVEWFKHPRRELDRLIDRIENERERVSGTRPNLPAATNGKLNVYTGTLQDKNGFL